MQSCRQFPWVVMRLNKAFNTLSREDKSPIPLGSYATDKECANRVRRRSSRQFPWVVMRLPEDLREELMQRFGVANSLG